MSAENGLPVITRYFIPESSHARLRINCPNCTSEWGWCVDSPTNEAILQGLIATHVRVGCVFPPGECVCPPDFCLGTDSDSGMRVECAACLALDPELPCLRDIPLGGPDA